MSNGLTINNLLFARESASLQGFLPVARFTRLADNLLNTSGEVAWQLDGFLTGNKKAQLQLTVKGDLQLCCQRCLSSLVHPIKIDALFELVKSEDEIMQEAIEDDSKDFLLIDAEFDIASLIEDELILDLPFAPKHDHCALPVKAEKETKESLSPFAGLKNFIVH